MFNTTAPRETPVTTRDGNSATTTPHQKKLHHVLVFCFKIHPTPPSFVCTSWSITSPQSLVTHTHTSFNWFTQVSEQGINYILGNKAGHTRAACLAAARFKSCETKADLVCCHSLILSPKLPGALRAVLAQLIISQPTAGLYQCSQGTEPASTVMLHRKNLFIWQLTFTDHSSISWNL